ncbi:MAG: PEGA domain-containing protein [Bradymonadaceae bacterium]
MQTPRFWSALLLVAGLVVVVSPSGVRAAPADSLDELSEQERSRVQSYVKKGRAAYNQGNFETSLDAFQNALELLEHPDFVYRVALAHERLGHLREAIDAYRRFLEMAPPDAKDRGKVRRTIEKLRQRLNERQPTLEVSTQPSGAKVVVDGESGPRGRTSMRVPVEPGKHTVVLHKEGFESVRRTVEIAPGETMALQVALEETSGGAPVRSDKPGVRVGPIVTLSGAGLLTVASIVSFTQFNKYRGRVEDARACAPECDEPPNFDQNVDRQKNWEVTTWALGSLAVASTTAGVIWLLTSKDSGDSERSARRLRVVPAVGPRRVGVAVSVEGIFR